MKFIVNETTGQVVARLPDDWSGQCPVGCRLVVGSSESAVRSMAEERAALDADMESVRVAREDLEARHRDKDREMRSRILDVERREAACRRIERGIGRGKTRR